MSRTMPRDIALTAAEADRFWAKVEKGSPNSCWPWTKDTNNKGYGKFNTWHGGQRQSLLAHRVAYHLTHKTSLQGFVLLHRCDNPPCCNPSHLKPGTQADNVADAHAKGRMSPPPHPCGEDSPRARLTAADVAAIRRRYAQGGVLQRELAAEYGVAQTSVSRIVRGAGRRGVRLIEDPDTGDDMAATA
jgi:hypothetical protein